MAAFNGGMVAYGEHCLRACDGNPKAALAKFLAGTGDGEKAAGNADALANGVLDKFQELMPRAVQFNDVSDAAYTVALQVASHAMQWLSITLRENGYVPDGCDPKQPVLVAEDCGAIGCCHEILDSADAKMALADSFYNAAERLHGEIDNHLQESRLARYDAANLLADVNRKVDEWEKKIAAVPLPTLKVAGWPDGMFDSLVRDAVSLLPFRKSA